jgi:hypothetical protein
VGVQAAAAAVVEAQPAEAVAVEEAERAQPAAAPVAAEAQPAVMVVAPRQAPAATEARVEAPVEVAQGLVPAGGSRAEVVEVPDDDSPPPGWD